MVSLDGILAGYRTHLVDRDEHASIVPISLAWEAFVMNGAESLEVMTAGSAISTGAY